MFRRVKGAARALGCAWVLYAATAATAGVLGLLLPGVWLGRRRRV